METLARPKRINPPRSADATPGRRMVQFYVPDEIHLNFVMHAVRNNVPVMNVWAAFAEKYAPGVDFNALTIAPKFPKARRAK